MALPTSRNTTYSPGTKVRSADLNDIQDKIIDINAALPDEDPATKTWTGAHTFEGALTATGGLTTDEADVRHASRRLLLHASAGQAGAEWTWSGLGHWYGAAGSDGACYFPIPVAVGSRIKYLTAYVKDAVGDTLTVAFNRIEIPTGSISVLNSQASNNTGAKQNVVIDLSGAPYTVLSGYAYAFSIAGGSDASHLIYAVEFDFDRVA